MIRFLSVLQTHWDWRAAGNFILGGAGSSLLFMAVFFAYPNSPSLLITLLALALVGGGLFCVWLEIGRPWRFMNVFFHPHTSWMTREGAVAVLLLAVAITGTALKSPVLMLAAGLLGLVFVYCQGRILKASKGIPAWREPSIVSLIILTGLCEGAAILVLAFAIQQTASAGLHLAALVFLLGRFLCWRVYKKALRQSWLPAETLSVITKVDAVLLIAGTLIPGVLLLGLIVFTGLAEIAPWLITPAWLCAAVGMIAGGWYMKFCIITRAAQNQGFALAKVQRGRPKMQPPIARKGDKFVL